MFSRRSRGSKATRGIEETKMVRRGNEGTGEAGGCRGREGQ